MHTTTEHTTTEQTTAPDRRAAPIGTAEVAARLERIGRLIENRSVREARKVAGRVLADADPAAQRLALSCFTALERHHKVRDAMFDRLSADHAADLDACALIDAFRPRPEGHPADTGAATPERAQAARRDRDRRDRIQHAPTDRPTRRTTPRRPTRSTRRADTEKATARYFDEPTEPESPTGWDDYDQLDYDRAAVPALRGRACGSCNTERSVSDQRTRPDDGLCEGCRESGRVGIAAPGQDPAATVDARCAAIVAHATSITAAETALRADWHRASTHDRAIIAAYVARWKTTRTNPGR